jgi:hypothetical protein
MTPIIPFCVTMLGAFLNTRPTVRAEDLRPGWAAVRRSLLIACCVGGTIITLNQGDVLLAGAITPRVMLKMLVTPCVPFCVSFYTYCISSNNSAIVLSYQWLPRNKKRDITLERGVTFSMTSTYC